MIRSVAAMAKTPSANASSLVVSTAASVRPHPDASGAELLDEPRGVPVFPASAAGVHEVAVELHERVDEVASDRGRAKDIRKLGVVEEPVGVETRPVGVVAVGDPVH